MIAPEMRRVVCGLPWPVFAVGALLLLHLLIRLGTGGWIVVFSFAAIGFFFAGLMLFVHWMRRTQHESILSPS